MISSKIVFTVLFFATPPIRRNLCHLTDHAVLCCDSYVVSAPRIIGEPIIRKDELPLLQNRLKKNETNLRCAREMLSDFKRTQEF